MENIAFKNVSKEDMLNIKGNGIVKCVLGTVGSTGIGFLGGAGVGTVTLPIIGTVSGGTVGAWSGAATGVATFC